MLDKQRDLSKINTNSFVIQSIIVTQSCLEGTMSEKLNLKELERKAWRSFFDDGLWDIYLGLLLALMGVSAFMGRMELSEVTHMGIYIGLLIIIMLLMWAAKRFITVPRIGRVKFGAERQKRRIKRSLVLLHRYPAVSAP